MYQTEFRDEPGNYLALKFVPTEGAIVKAGFDTDDELTTIGTELNGAWLVEDKDIQKFVVEVSKDGKTVTNTYDLSGLILETE